MAISVILVSSDSSKDKVGTPVGRLILFGTILTTIPDTTPVITPPTTQTDTTVIPTETPIITPTIPPSLDYTPASPDYSLASDIESDPSEDPSSGHIPPLPARSPVIPRRQVMILAPGQPIPHGRPYRYHPNRPIHMMTSRKRVGPLPVQQLAVRHSFDHSSSDSSSRHSLSDHSSPDLPSTSVGPSCKIRRSTMTSIPALPPVSKALSPVRADLIPSPKRVRDIGYLADEGAVQITYETLGDLVQRFHDHTQAIPVYRIQVIEGVQREQGHRIVRVESAVTALTKRVVELERDNMWKMPNTQSRASMTHEKVEELVAHRVAEEMEARESARNLKTLNENVDDQEGENGGNEGNGNGDNGANGRNGNGWNEGNRNHGMNYGGTEGVVRLTRCALTWWNSHKRTIGIDAAYAMKWAGLRKLMTEEYCPRNEIQKMETELWNLTVKGNDLTSYTQ
nr:reverse transcriptase domain-containing protein [Tanacetum cinerariifolium]